MKLRKNLPSNPHPEAILQQQQAQLDLKRAEQEQFHAVEQWAIESSYAVLNPPDPLERRLRRMETTQAALQDRILALESERSSV